jgi:hypothetical protein
MKNAVFLDVAPCRSCVNRRFGGTYGLHLHGRKIREGGTSVRRWLQAEFSTGSSVCSHLLTLVPRSRILYPEDGGDTFLRNVGSHKIFTAPHPRRRHSSVEELLKASFSIRSVSYQGKH